MRLFNNPTCHCEPFAFCHSEPFASCHSEEAKRPKNLTQGKLREESHGAQDRLREAISLLLSEIASPDKSGSQ